MIRGRYSSSLGESRSSQHGANYDYGEDELDDSSSCEFLNNLSKIRYNLMPFNPFHLLKLTVKGISSTQKIRA